MPENSIFNTCHHIFSAFLVASILIIASLIAKKQMRNQKHSVIPIKKLQVSVFFEIILENISYIMKDIIGPNYKKHIPVVSTLTLFILFSNLLGLAPGLPPSTDNLNTSLACGIIVFFYFNLNGIRENGIQHFTHLANPIGIWWGWFLSPLFLPIEIIGITVRPFSLGIRLTGNMIGDHKVLLTFTGLMPIIFPIPFFILGLMVCLIQTGVFCILTCIYISLHSKNHS